MTTVTEVLNELQLKKLYNEFRWNCSLPKSVTGYVKSEVCCNSTNQTMFISHYPNLKFLSPDIEYSEYLCQTMTDLGFNIVPIYDRPIDEPVDCGCKRKNKRSCYYSAKGTFINFIRLNNHIILPEYSMPQYQKEINYSKVNEKVLADSGFNVIRINCDELARFGGSLHCLSWQV